MTAPAPVPELPTRRGLLRALGRRVMEIGVGAGLLEGFLAVRRGEMPPAGARGALGVVRPPGSVAEREFLARCVRCTRCADACEAQCIRFFGPEAGALQGTPYIMTADAACTMCFKCGPACPSAAIEPVVGREEAMRPPAKMGTAVVDERLCVSHNGTGVCGACHTACPLRNRAITQNARNAPVVHPELCTGCGLCEEMCIVRDRRAIQVFSTRVLTGAHGEA